MSSCDTAVGIARFGVNRIGCDFVVGDIHGCFFLLDALLARLQFDGTRDRLFSVGDLIDRGPDSERALEWLARPWFHAIRGNHEQMLLDGLRHGGDAQRLWQANGGDWFVRLSPAVATDWIHAFEALPLAAEIELGDGRLAALAHADVPDDWALVQGRLAHDDQAGITHDQLMNTLLWARYRAGEVERRRHKSVRWWHRPQPVHVRGVDLIYFGHTPMPAPTRCANTRWLDTGAFMGGTLTVAELSMDGAAWSAATERSVYCCDWQYVDD